MFPEEKSLHINHLQVIYSKSLYEGHTCLSLNLTAHFYVTNMASGMVSAIHGSDVYYRGMHLENCGDQIATRLLC